MVQALHADQHAGVRIETGRVVIQDVVESDPIVVAVISDAPDREFALHSCLQVGARVSKAAQATLEAEVLERTVSELTEGFSATVNDAVETIVGKTNGLLDEEDGALTVVLGQLRSDLATQLDTAFDPDSKTSALAKMEAIFSGSASKLATTLRSSLDPSDERSPLGQWKREVLNSLSESLGLVLTQLAELRAELAANDARSSTMALTAIKGLGFEDRVHSVVSTLASRHGDLADHVGAVRGSAGDKAGDEVVELCLDDTAGRRVAIVFEAKDRKLGLRKTHEELARAMANRDAEVAIAVFSSLDAAPSAAPFSHHANKAIVVLDDDDRALELAYLWARWVARRAQLSDAGSYDQERISAALADARQALSRASTVRGCHTRAKKQIDLAGGELEALVGDVDSSLASLRLELEGESAA